MAQCRIRGWPTRGAARLVVLAALSLAPGMAGCGPAPLPPRPSGLASLDAPAPRSITFAGAYENRKNEPWAPLVRASAVVALPDGGFFLADYGGGMLHVFDKDGAYLVAADDPGGGLAPLDLAELGFLVYVLDANRRTVLRYDERGVYRDVFMDIATIDPAQPIRPSAIDIDRDGRLAVADENGHRVLVSTPFARLETVVGEYGSFVGQFKEPRGVAFGPTGVLYVSDRGNRRVQAFDRTGQPLAATPSVMDPEPLFVAPSGLDTDRFGNVYVADSGSGRVRVLAPDLFPLAIVGGDEFADDHLQLPIDCAVSADDRLYIVDAGRGALLVYDLTFP
jgi:sugar lactone lactonase YvrE